MPFSVNKNAQVNGNAAKESKDVDQDGLVTGIEKNTHDEVCVLHLANSNQLEAPLS